LRVSTQAAEVVAVTGKENDPQRLETALPEGSIAKLLSPVAGLKGIEQAYPSFGGRPPEANDRFDRRVSELLRHKGRAITLHDYESLVLEAFPRVYRVKCLTHTLGVRGDADRDMERAPGNVTVVVVPDVKQVSAVNPYEPRLPAAELEAIRQNCSERAAPCATISVLNPAYERIRLTLCVRFHPGKSTAFYRNRLQQDLRGLLAPWTRAEAAGDISFGGRFYYSTAVHFVEELEYVDFVRDLRILDPEEGPVTFHAARYARSVLTTVNGPNAEDQHQIIVLED
ncbi:MAG: baseplate J/gp47 family protein, partial [Lewinella sp.]